MCRRFNESLIAFLLFSARALAQGTFILGQQSAQDCPPGYVCHDFTVDAPGIPGTPGKVALKRSAGNQGLVIFFSGSGGGRWFLNTPISLLMGKKLSAAGYDVAMVRWSKGWIYASPGQVIGSIPLSQRPATVIQWCSANLKRGGRMIVVGTSNGSSQIAYSMAFYHADAVIDQAVLVSGPPFMSQCDACLGTNPNMEFYPDNKNYIDLTAGFSGTTGPCRNKNPNWCQFWNEQSIEHGGVYNYPGTTIKILVGVGDTTFITYRASDYGRLLAKHGQEKLTTTFVPKTGHSFVLTQEGVDAIYAAVGRNR